MDVHQCLEKKVFATIGHQENENIKSVHCMVHRESLASKSLPPALLIVMNQVINVVNSIKGRPLRSRIFDQLCDAMDSGYKTLHTEGKVLKRLKKIVVLTRFNCNRSFELLHNKLLNDEKLLKEKW